MGAGHMGTLRTIFKFFCKFKLALKIRIFVFLNRLFALHFSKVRSKAWRPFHKNRS